MIHQVVFDTAELLYLKGIRHVVLSPGSRNAPLTLSFARHPKLKVYSIIDERSAGFIALGIALRTKSPVVICCTSGTAMLNYLPAIAEAYYQQIPLIILSADRPQEWIDQRDGQTINQVNAASNFVKGFYQMPGNYEQQDEQWEFNRKMNEAVNLSSLSPVGPVHVNIPFKEPFYPAINQELIYSKKIRVFETINTKPSTNLDESLIKGWAKYEKKLIVIGQNDPDDQLRKALIDISEKEKIPVVTDIISNQEDDTFIKYHDHYLGKLSDEQIEVLKPDLLITGGRSIISKPLKLFLRKNKPEEHWHFEDIPQPADTFQSITKSVLCDIRFFLEGLLSSNQTGSAFSNQLKANYILGWKVLDKKARQTVLNLKNVPYSEYQASVIVASAIPKKSVLHLANSMSVRYANLVRAQHSPISICSNRGTSGIDGTNGTAVGDALVNESPVVLWTGDLSFFYDKNAFFHSHNISNLRIIVMNNQGGGIFRLINGPSKLPELTDFFETNHNHSARFMASEFGFDYYAAKDMGGLEKGLEQLFDKKQQKKILEIFTEPSMNQEVYNKIKNISYE